MVVPDALADQRFCTSDLVTSEPHIRFYAGAPLLMSDGTALGTLCVVDTVPRDLSEPQRTALAALSRSIVSELELRALDLTARKAVEEALRASEERYRLLFATMAQGVIYQDASGCIIDANPAAERALGMSLDQLQGRTSLDPSWKALHEDGSEFPGNEHPAMVALRTGHPVHQVIIGVYNPTEQQLRWHAVNATPLFQAGEDRPSQVYTTFEDVTERRQTQQELLNLTQSLEERVRARTAEVLDLYEHAPTGYQSLDANGIIVNINQTQLSWLGYTRAELIGRPFTDVIATQDHAKFWERNGRLKLQGRLSDTDYQFVRKDGTTFCVSISATALYDQAGDYVMSRCSVIDNTERKRAELAQQAAHEEMVRALRTKDEFLANMSHELRTPLNAILGLSESLREGVRGPLNERQHEALGYIEASGQHLLALINDILDLSKIEAGRLELQLESVGVADLCRASLRLVREQALKKQLRLAFTLSDELAELIVDAKRLKQILVNLLSNAVKFTPAGGTVSLEVTILPEAQLARFSVRDTGIGISSGGLEQLFQPFTQLDARLNRQHEGTGLGLALVRRLTELHGGTVTAESEPGVGSCFTISLPCCPT